MAKSYFLFTGFLQYLAKNMALLGQNVFGDFFVENPGPDQILQKHPDPILEKTADPDPICKNITVP